MRIARLLKIVRGSDFFICFCQRHTRSVTPVICILFLILPSFCGCGHEPVEVTGHQKIEDNMKRNNTVSSKFANGNPEKPTESDKLPKILSDEEAKNALKNLIENSDDEGLKVLAKRLDDYSSIEVAEENDLYEDENIPGLSQEDTQSMSPNDIKDFQEEYEYRVDKQNKWNDDVKKCHFIYVYSSLCNLSKGTFESTVFMGGGAVIQVFEGVFIEENNEWKAFIKNKSFGDSAGYQN